MNIVFNELRQQRVKYDVHTTSKIKHTRHFLLLIYPQFWLELFCNAVHYNQMGVSWPTGSWVKHSDWLRLRLMDQSQEILLGHAIFASSEYIMASSEYDGEYDYHRIARSISNKII